MAAIEGLLQGLYPPLSGDLNPITAPPPPSPTPQRNIEQKVLEVITQVLGLLTAEIHAGSSIQCDVPLKEETEEAYVEDGGRVKGLEGHWGPHGEATAAGQQLLAAPAGRCPRPAHSREATQEDHNYCSQSEGQSGVKVEDEEEEALSVEGCRGFMEEGERWVDVRKEEDTSVLDERWSLEEAGITIKQEEEASLGADQHPAENIGVTVKEEEPSPALPVQHTLEEVGMMVDIILEEHPTDVSTGHEAFVCRDCGKCCATRELLDSHRQSHVGFKPFRCPECGKCFTTKTSLNTHQRLHSGNKPYECSECGKRFVRRTNLNNHHRVHTGERPFQCSLCGKCFTWKPVLLKHQKSHVRREKKLLKMNPNLPHVKERTLMKSPS